MFPIFLHLLIPRLVLEPYNSLVRRIVKDQRIVNLYNSLVRRHSSSLSPSLSPCLTVPVIWLSLWRLFQKAIEGLEGKINRQALGTALRLCLRRPPPQLCRGGHPATLKVRGNGNPRCLPNKCRLVFPKQENYDWKSVNRQLQLSNAVRSSPIQAHQWSMSFFYKSKGPEMNRDDQA